MSCGLDFSDAMKFSQTSTRVEVNKIKAYSLKKT